MSEFTIYRKNLSSSGDWKKITPCSLKSNNLQEFWNKARAYLKEKKGQLKEVHYTDTNYDYKIVII